MNALLQPIVALPGVVGGMVVDRTGAISATSFPPVFDGTLLQDGASEVLSLLDLHPDASQVEFRCTGGIVLARPAPAGVFVIVSEPGVNRQLLSLVVAGAARKLHRVRTPVPAETPAAPVAPQPPPAGAPAESRCFEVVEGMPRLRVELAQTSAATYWDNMLEAVALTQHTADEIFRHYRSKPGKKIKVMCGRSRTTKTFPIRIIADDHRSAHTGKAFLTRSAAEALALREGDQVFLQPATGEGLFGWEGI